MKFNISIMNSSLTDSVSVAKVTKTKIVIDNCSIAA